MITDDDVMRLFEQADPARTTDDVNNSPDATGYLAALRQRSNNVTYIHPTEDPTEEPGRRRRFGMIAAAAAAVVLVVGALVFAARDDEGGQEIPATIPTALVDEPTGQAAGFLAAFATGDPVAVAALQVDAFAMRYGWPRESPGTETLGEQEWLGAAYQTGHATNYADPTCTLVDEADGVAVVECETVMELALHHATNTPGLGVTVTLQVGDDGVIAMESAYARNFSALGPFDDWQAANRPDALPDDDSSDPQTAEESFERARTEAQLVAEWVEWATAAVESAFTAHNSGDLDAFLSRFGESAHVLGVAATDARDVVAALMAGGQQYEASGCVPDGIDLGLAIVCDVVVRPPAHEFSGVEVDGTTRMIVFADGTILSRTYSVDVGSIDEFNTAFEQWLRSTHPDVHAQVTWVEVGESRIASAGDQPLVAPYYDEFVAQSDVYPLDG